MHDGSTESTLVIVRHGETEWSASGRHTGKTDIPLTPAGVSAAEALRPRLAAWSPVRVLSSPRVRATATAEHACIGADAEIDDDLAEWDYGDYEGRTTDEIRLEIPRWTIWRGTVPHGESIDDVAARADRVIARVVAAETTVLCFAHGHISRVLAARWCELEPTAGERFALDTAHYAVLGHEREVRVIKGWNL